MAAKVTRWFIFSVLLGVLAIVVAAALLWSRDKPHNLATLLGRGQLLPVCASLAGKAVADAFLAPIDWKARKALVGGLSVVLWFFVATYMAELSNFNDVVAQKVADMSVYSFLFAIVLGVAAIGIDSVKVDGEQS